MMHSVLIIAVAAVVTVALRFYRGFTQAKTARVLKVSQVQVSRLERRAMQHLREILQAEE